MTLEGEPPAKGPVKSTRERATTPPDEKPRKPFSSRKQERMFDQFWLAYPKKRGKGDAEKAWASICPNAELFAAILRALEFAKACSDWQRDGGKYIPYPATWLRRKGWEDEYAASIDYQRSYEGW
jgi:hypothetical protein